VTKDSKKIGADVNTERKTPGALTRWLRLGCFVLMLCLIIQIIPHAPGQRDTSKRIGRNGTELSTTSSDSILGVAVDAVLQAKFPLAAPLWDQYNDPATEPPVDIGSQNFEPALAALDDQAADDFSLTIPRTNCITEVHVLGEYSAGGGPASSFNVYFYANGAGNLPGTLLAAFVNLPYSGTPPDFVILLPGPYSLCVTPGTYWISVQARQDSNPNGQWFWHNRTVQSNAGAVWHNPGDGYGTGCIAWNRKNACMTDQIWPD